MRTESRWRWLFLSVLMLAVSLPLQSQTTATIIGTVRDQSGAVIPGSMVTATNVETGLTRTTETGSRGGFRFSSLRVGVYDLRVTMAGFQTSVREGVTLSVGQEAVVDFSLGIGDVAEQVTVTGEAPMIDTTTATVSGLVEPRQMREIPLNARSFLELVPLQAGAVVAEAGDSSVTKGFGKKLAISGQRYSSNLFLLDGADINDSGGVSGSAADTVAGMETVREFRVVTNAYDAEYGRHTGGVISAITKSGTNSFHGSAFEFLRNAKLDANKWEDNAFQGGEKPPFKRNQFGGSLGGPVLQDRLFFFGSYEGMRERLSTTNTSTVPGMAMREGFLGGQFVGVDPEIQPFLQSYPVPNSPDRSDGTALYARPASQPTNQDYGTARVDSQLSDTDSLFGRFTIDNASRTIDQANGVNTSNVSSTASRYATLEETHIFSPELISRTHLSFSRTNLRQQDVALSGFTFPMFSFTDTGVPGNIAVEGLDPWGGAINQPKFYVQNVYQFKQDFFFNHGRHAIKFGGMGERFQFNQTTAARAGGDFEFNNFREFFQKDVSVAHFLIPGTDFIRGFRQGVVGLYFHDDISVRQGLTVNLGLRYEFITTPFEHHGRMATIRDLRPHHFYTVTKDETDTGAPMFLNPSLKNFAPRIGVAWSPFPSGKTSIRAGFGTFYDQLLPSIYSGVTARVPPYFGVGTLFREITSIDFPDAFFSQSEALIKGINVPPEADGFEWNPKQSTVYKWSLNAEHEVLPDMKVEAGYSGARGVHLTRGAVNLNATPAEMRPHPDGGERLYVLIDQPLLNPNWARLRWRINDATSDYHAFLLSANKRFSSGLGLQISYTFSKSTDDTSTWTGSSDYGAGDRRGYLTSKDHALSSFNVQHSFVTNLIYEVPGRNLSGAAGHLLGGWSLSSLLRLNSGHPFNLTASQPQLRRGSDRFTMRFVDGPRLDVIPGGDTNPISPQNPDQYFDPGQFSFPVDFFLGNLGRNTVISPGVANVDFSLMKDTQMGWLGESGALQFRAEFFNLFNRVNFDVPSARSLFNSSGRARSGVGQITSTRTSARQIQFGLRLVF